ADGRIGVLVEDHAPAGFGQAGRIGVLRHPERGLRGTPPSPAELGQQRRAEPESPRQPRQLLRGHAGQEILAGAAVDAVEGQTPDHREAPPPVSPNSGQVARYSSAPRYWRHSSMLRLRPAMRHAVVRQEARSMSQRITRLSIPPEANMRPSGLNARLQMA